MPKELPHKTLPHQFRLGGTAFGIRMTREVGFDTIDAKSPIVNAACVAVGLVDFNASVQRLPLQRCKAYLDLVYEFEAKNFLLELSASIRWSPPRSPIGCAKH